jgi:Fis family transcriptional regulator
MSRQDIDTCIRKTLQQYFQDLDGEPPRGVHEMLVAAVEKPMLEVVMDRAEGNQSRAAEWLGINRNTLRRKLLDHGLAS